MQLEITGEKEYQQAMQGVERYFKAAYIPNEKVFSQGMHYYHGQGWVKNKTFATDCQTWAILTLGPKKIEVLSLASTCWVALMKLDFNPFILGG